MSVCPKKKHKGASLPNFGEASLAKLGLLACLLPLLRSGALKSPLDPGGLNAKGSQSATPKSRKPKESAPAAEKIPGWKFVKPGKQKKSMESAGTPAQDVQPPKHTDVVGAGGFSCESGTAVSVVPSVADLKIDIVCICLGTKKEALQAWQEVNTRQPMAILTPTPVDANAPMVHVFVKDAAGIEQVRRRFFCQLGPKQIQYMSDAPAGCKVQAETEKVVVGVMRDISPCWGAAMQNHKIVFGNLLRETAIVGNIVEIQRPNLSSDKLDAVVLIKKGVQDSCLKASGQN